MKKKRHVIAVKNASGAVELHPMKDWLRNHLEAVPAGLDVSKSGSLTSHAIRNVLKKHGWSMRESEDQVTLVRPDIADDPQTVAVIGASDEEDDAPEAAEEYEFALESHLRDFIERNIATLGPAVGGKRLRLFVDGKSRNGIEYPTDVGPIDILAVDDVTGDYYVFELKLMRGPDKAMGQLMRYMGWVQRKVAGDRKTYGVIVAKTIDEKLKYAALPIGNDVLLLEYEVNFKLTPAALT